MIELISILWKWKKLLIGLAIASVLAGVAVAFLLPVYYQSTARFVVANPAMYERSALFLEKPEKPIYPFGGKEDVNRILAIADSEELADFVIEKFDLYSVYEIDPDDPEGRHFVREELAENFEAKKNALGTVEVSVLDKDRQRAADMSNAILERVDQAYSQMVFSKQKDFYDIVKKEAVKKQNTVDYLVDSLRTIVQRNPEDTVSSGLLLSITESAVSNLNAVKSIENQFASVLGQTHSLLYVLNKATPAVKKAKPVRWLVVASFLITAMIVGVLGLLIFERVKQHSSQV